MQLGVMRACPDLTMWLPDAVLVKDAHFTLAHHRVSSSSVVRASNQITEDGGFESHLGLGFFQSFHLMQKHIMSLYFYKRLPWWKPVISIYSPYFWMGMYGCQQGLLFCIPVCNLKK